MRHAQVRRSKRAAPKSFVRGIWLEVEAIGRVTVGCLILINRPVVTRYHVEYHVSLRTT